MSNQRPVRGRGAGWAYVAQDAPLFGKLMGIFLMYVIFTAIAENPWGAFKVALWILGVGLVLGLLGWAFVSIFAKEETGQAAPGVPPPNHNFTPPNIPSSQPYNPVPPTNSHFGQLHDELGAASHQFPSPNYQFPANHQQPAPNNQFYPPSHQFPSADHQ